MRVKRSTQLGVTLVELLIVISIVSILAAIAYPSYLAHVQKTRYADAKIKLLEIMQEQRKYFTSNNTYTVNIVDDLPFSESGTQQVITDNGFYLIAATNCAGEPNNPPFNCILLTATATFDGGTEQLTYNSRNQVSGPPNAW